KDKTGLGQFAATGDYQGPTFRVVDVFSLGLRYSDSDVNSGGALSLRENALDYDLFFHLAGGGIVQGNPTTVFISGWTGTSLADNYLARWLAPEDAVGIFIFALDDNGHDGVTQIDAVIVPEPSSLALLAAGAALLRRRRK
ncbi:MAG: PEP-CTERM sorting domain-containing protein, partial [Planctomycetota bacterium]